MPTLLESPFLSLGMIDTLLRTTTDPAQRVQLLAARVHRLQLEPAIQPSSSHSSLSSHSASHGHGHHQHHHPNGHGAHPYAHAAHAAGHLSGLAALAAHQPRATRGPGAALLDEYGHAHSAPAFEHGHERPAALYGDGFGFELDLSRATSRATSRANSRANSRAPSPVRSSGGNTRAGSPTRGSPAAPRRPARPDPTPLLRARAALVGAYLALAPPDLHAAEAEAAIVLAECRRIVKWEKARIRKSGEQEAEHAERKLDAPVDEKRPESKEDSTPKKEKEEPDAQRSSSPSPPALHAPPAHVSPAWYAEVLKIQLETTRYEAKINEGLGRESRAQRASKLAEELAAELSNL